MKKNKHLFVLLILILLLANLPTLKKTKSGAEYFSLYSAPDDVWNQYFFIRNRLENPGKLGEAIIAKEKDSSFQQAIWGYSVASLALVDSGFTQEAKSQLKTIIKSVEKKTASGNDETEDRQVRLSLLYNLYHRLFPDTTFSQESQELMIKLFQKLKDREKYNGNMERLHSSSLVSNPELYLSFAIFDSLNNTDFSAISKNWLSSVRKTFNGKTESEATTNLNWNIIFLSGINKPLADSLYQKSNPTDKLIKRKSEIQPGILLAAAAARAVQDTTDFIKLIRFIKKNTRPVYEGNYLYFDRLDFTENILFLFAKVCRFYELLHDRKHQE